MRITLAEKDRERFSVPEVIEYEEMDLTLGEVVALEEQAGITFDVWADMLRGDPVPVEEGREPRYRRSYRTQHVILWLAVRKAGVNVKYKDFDVSLSGLKVLQDEVAVEEPGKEPGPDGSELPDSPATTPS